MVKGKTLELWEDGYLPEEIQGKPLKKLVRIGSRHSPEEAVELVFYLKCAGDVVEVASRLARDETTGGWVGRGHPTALFKKSMADLDRVYVYGKDEGIIVMRTPVSNMSGQDPLYQMMMLAVGGPVLEFVYYSAVAFLDFRLPGKLRKKFPGPAFGLEGVRKLVGSERPWPILGTIVKPCAGLTAREVAQKCYLAARGGCQFIKDDEKMLGPDYCEARKKIRLVAQALRKAYEETGNRCLYAPHLVARADRLLDTARRYLEWGATALMLNVILGHNVEVLKILRECREITVPLYAHSGGRSGLSTGPRRIDDTVWVKLVRLCGGDFFQHGVFGVEDVHVASRKENLLNHLVRVMREKVPGIRDTIPVAAGGLNLDRLELNLFRHCEKQYGYGVALLAGSHLLNDPDGPENGARRF
ncbi:MAG TPA: RuBisCO large subunit C-terminal-like domain-containing protein, partial [bacterium]|nr:RuBisCO large subunit C-terminal-like domain-containing protein [bacterium]